VISLLLQYRVKFGMEFSYLQSITQQHLITSSLTPRVTSGTFPQVRMCCTDSTRRFLLLPCIYSKVSPCMRTAFSFMHRQAWPSLRGFSRNWQLV